MARRMTWLLCVALLVGLPGVVWPAGLVCPAPALAGHPSCCCGGQAAGCCATAGPSVVRPSCCHALPRRLPAGSTPSAADVKPPQKLAALDQAAHPLSATAEGQEAIILLRSAATHTPTRPLFVALCSYLS